MKQTGGVTVRNPSSFQQHPRFSEASPPEHPDPHRSSQALTDYPALFPLARSFARQWTLYVGPTNSGKTHAALEHLRKASCGVYLGPLRLMALENADALIEAGIPCNLRTGEEHRECVGAHHVASTIEMADLSKMVDVAVVDEAQLLLDPDRGWAWTQALVGLPAGHLVLTGSPECEPAVRALAERLGEPLTVVTLARKSPLAAARAPVKLRDLRAGDALVVFSRRAALDWRAVLIERGWSVATLYGALGPEVRRSEARRFREGKAQILVATDAIGMGLNLPIHRVVFAEAEKYDGTSMRPLKPSEWRQVGGRAGRYGVSQRGEVGVLTTTRATALRELQQAIERLPKARSGAPSPFVWLPWSALAGFEPDMRKPGLAPLMVHAYTQALDPALWRAPDLNALLPLAHALDQTELPMPLRYRYLGCPVDEEHQALFTAVSYWATAHGSGKQVPWGEHSYAPMVLSELTLAHEERIASLAGAYLWLAQRWPKVYVDAQRARHRQMKANALIEDILAREGEKLCAQCGDALPRRQPGRVCKDCRRAHSSRGHGQRHRPTALELMD